MSGARVIKFAALATAEGLTADQKIAAVAAGLEWLGVAMGLKMIHSEKFAAQRLAELGCPLGFDGDGNLMIIIPAGKSRGKP